MVRSPAWLGLMRPFMQEEMNMERDGEGKSSEEQCSFSRIWAGVYEPMFKGYNVITEGMKTFWRTKLYKIVLYFTVSALPLTLYLANAYPFFKPQIQYSLFWSLPWCSHSQNPHLSPNLARNCSLPSLTIKVLCVFLYDSTYTLLQLFAYFSIKIPYFISLKNFHTYNQGLFGTTGSQEMLNEWMYHVIYHLAIC